MDTFYRFFLTTQFTPFSYFWQLYWNWHYATLLSTQSCVVANFRYHYSSDKKRGLRIILWVFARNDRWQYELVYRLKNAQYLVTVPVFNRFVYIIRYENMILNYTVALVPRPSRSNNIFITPDFVFSFQKNWKRHSWCQIAINQRKNEINNKLESTFTSRRRS